MKYTLFADSNIFLDAILKRVDAGEDCQQILELAFSGDIKLFTSVSCLMNVIYFLQKASVPSRSIVEIIEDLLKATSFSSPNESLFVTALHSGFSDLEDAVQYHTALQIKGIDYFLTSNVKDFKKATSQLPVLSPKQFMKRFNN